jgi:preprotein translocase subunit SecD
MLREVGGSRCAQRRSRSRYQNRQADSPACPGQKSKQALTAFSSAEIGRKVELRVDDRVVAAPAIREPLSTRIQISDVSWTDEVAAAIAGELAKPNAKIELGPIKE